MSERVTTAFAAYSKGAAAAANSKRKGLKKKSSEMNPYGITKRELQCQWFAGYHDYLSGYIDSKGNPL